jgi:hypothetical protein
MITEHDSALARKEIRIGMVGANAYSTPGFDHALHNARLIDAVRRAAERGKRQQVLEQIESFDEARVTSVD